MDRYWRSCGAVLFSLLLWIDAGGAQEKLTLQEAIELALQQNPQLAFLQQEIAAAQGQVMQAAALPPAEIFSRLGEISPNFREIDEIEIGLRQNFEFPGKRGHRKAVADADWQIAQLQMARRRILLAAEVRQRYYESLLAGENLASRQFAVQILKDLQQLLVEQYRGGASGYVEVIRARLELGRGRSDLADARREYSLALAKLKLLLAWESDQPLELSDSLIYIPLTVPRDSLLARVIRQSNLRQVFLTAVERQRRTLRLAQLAGRPDFSLGAAFQRVAEEPPFTAAQPGGQVDNVFALEASITLPLFNRAAAKGEAQTARAELAAAERRLAYFEQQVRLNFEAAFAALAAAETQLREFREVVLPEAGNALNAGLVAYQAGQLSLTDLLDIYRTAQQTRLEKSRAMFKYLLALADLETPGERFQLNPAEE